MNELQNTQPQTKYKVLLIGDSCIDEYQIGTIERISPEAPVPIIKIQSIKKLPGMAANVNENLCNLGINTDFVTNTEIIIKKRYIDKKSGQHMLRVDLEPEINQWDGYTPSEIKQYDAIVISDYNKGFLSYVDIVTIIKSTDKPIFIDTKKPDLARFSGPHVFVKINETEYKNRYSIPENLIVTLGDRGAMIKRFNSEFEYETIPVDVVDVCGCGDTFLSALTYQFLKTKNIGESIQFANLASGITVRHSGNYAPTLEEIENGY
jgi:D-beta-D-heptose 7-phosphate kinase/D-beta-D-heptose 1-phosphate adenosyltransferase